VGAAPVADGFKLPRIRAADTISDKAGKAANAFVRFWDTVMKAIERQENAQTDVLDKQAQIQATQAQQLILVYQALELAGIAIDMSGAPGNTGVQSLTIDIDGSGWAPGPRVDLTGVVAGDLIIPSTGLYAGPTTTQGDQGEILGFLRLVEIVGVTETVVGGPWNFTSTRYDANPASNAVYIANPAEIPTFTVARTTTGAVSYRLDAMTDTVNGLLDVVAKLYVKRSA